MTETVKPTTDPKLLLSQAALSTAMKSPYHLKAWLDATGRRWLVFNAIELSEALTWPDGHEALGMIISAYRDHRRVIPTGKTEMMEHPDTREKVAVPLTKGEQLEPEELDRAIRYLVAQMYAIDPTWSLEKEAL